MSEDVTMIEQDIEQALYTSIKANVDALAAQDVRLTKVAIRGLFLAIPGLPAGTRRDDAPANRIMITCNPNIPQGFKGGADGANSFSPARTLKIDIDAITHPDDDPDRSLAAIMYKAVRPVFDDQKFTLPETIGLRGYLITDGSAGVSENGFEIKLTVSMKVFVRETGGTP